MNNYFKKYLLGCLLFFLLLTIAGSFNTILEGYKLGLSASVMDVVTQNNAKTASGFAWNDNTGWINFGTTTSNAEGRVYVSKDKLYGYAWGENIGWISLSCENDGTCGNVDYGVIQDPSNSGLLSGYAWGENIGWIDFNPNGGGVSISTSTHGTNNFSGYAWGENIGWISFSGETYGVNTEWTRSSGGTPPVPLATCTYDNPDWGTCINDSQSRTLTAINTPCTGDSMRVDTQSCSSIIIASTTPIEVSINPTNAEIFTGETLKFIATVTGTTTNNSVNWSVIPVENITPDFYGHINNEGVYFAPMDPHAVNVTIKATAQADITKIATAEVIVRILTATTSPCTSYVYSDWSTCLNNTQNRTILTYIPTNCSGGIVSTTTQTCTVATSTPPCTSYTYSDWSTCLNGTQNRNIINKVPANCADGLVTLTVQNCTMIVSTSTPTTTTPWLGTTTINEKPDPEDKPEDKPKDKPISRGGGSDNSTEDTGVIVAGLSSLSDNISGLLINNTAILGTTTEQIILEVKKIIETPAGNITTKVITTAGVVGGGVAVSSALAINGTMAADLLFLPFRLWGLLLSALGLKKRNRPWGTVYDSVTKQPIDPAYVTITNIETKKDETSITDLDGRYGFLVAPGKYNLVANKTNYTFPSKKLAGQKADALYSNLYFGEEIITPVTGAVISKNIPLDPVKFDWNEFVKGQKKLMKFYSRREKVMRIVTDWIFRIGFVISLISLFLVSAPYNLIIFGLYFVLYALRKIGLKQKKAGSLTDKDGAPLSFAIIRVFDAELKVEITTKVANQIGKYYCLVNKGKYYVKIEKKNDDESYTEVFTSAVFEAADGIIHSNFTI